MTLRQIDDDDRHDDAGRPTALSWAAVWVHRLEILFVVALSGLVLWNVARADRNMLDFSVIWGVVCLSAAAVALWPRTPRSAHLVAEAVLLAAALGELIGPRHDLFTFLNREIRDATRWNEMPLTQRRIMVWNIISAVGLLWLLPTIWFLYNIARQSRTKPVASIGYLALFIVVWGAMGFLLVLVVGEFFRG